MKYLNIELLNLNERQLPAFGFRCLIAIIIESIVSLVSLGLDMAQPTAFLEKKLMIAAKKNPPTLPMDFLIVALIKVELNLKAYTYSHVQSRNHQSSLI